MSGRRSCHTSPIRAVAGLILFVALLVPAPGPARAAQESQGPPKVADDVPATAVDLAEIRANNSPMLAVDPSDTRLMALTSRVDHPAFDCTLNVSRDGGQTWVSAYPVPKLPKGAERCYGPEIAFDGQGRLFFLFVGLHGAGNTPMGVFITSTTDLGRSFATPRKVLGANNFQVRMAMDTQRSGGIRMYLVWLAAHAEPSLGGFPSGANPIMSAFSDDGGESFSPPVQVSDPGRVRVVAPAIAVAPDHSVHVAYYDLRNDAVDYQGLEGPVWDQEWSLLLTSSLDGGKTFQPTVIVDDGVVPPERVLLIFTMPPPAVAALGGGRVLVGWHDARNGDWDVFVRSSTDNGLTWTETLRINDDAVGNLRHQYQPRLSAAPNGRVDIVFYDRRDDPENLSNHTSYSFSDDAGASFAPNQVLSDFPSRSTSGPTYPIPSAQGLIEFGSRIALVSTDDAAVAAWTDTRNSRLGEQQDIFANEVRFRGDPPLPAPDTDDGGSDTAGAWLWIMVGAGAVVVVGLGVLILNRRHRSEAEAS